MKNPLTHQTISPFLLSFFLFINLFGQPCPPTDTLSVTPPQNQWDIPYWNSWTEVEVVTWNIEHFPKSNTNTINGVAEVMLDMMADIYAIQEVDDKSAFQNQLMPLLPNYDYILSNESQNTNLGIIYRIDVLGITGSEELWEGTPYWDDGDEDYLNNALYYFAGRPPLRVDFTWSCGGETFSFSVINIHFKCCNEGLDRRRIAAQLLQYYLYNQMAMGDSNFIVLGDWNDDLVDDPPDDAFTIFLEDTPNFYFVTLPLAQDPTDYFDSYPNWANPWWSSFLDHILITQSLFEENESGVATTFHLDDEISNYDEIFSDHRPVGWKFPVEVSIRPQPPPNIVITEIMQNPSAVHDSTGEWFELYNADTSSIDLRGWTIRDDGRDIHVITAVDPIMIETGEYLVLSRNEDTSLNGGVEADYDYSGFLLSNGADEIILLDEDGLEVDRVEYDGGTEFPDPTGKSMALLDVNADNNVGSNWVESTVSFGDGDLGTPGEENYDVSLVEEQVIPEAFRLYQNYPNPFNPITTICFDLIMPADVRLVIYDLLGREITQIIDGFYNPGIHIATWNASDFGSGIFVYQIIVTHDINFTYKEARKLVVLK